MESLKNNTPKHITARNIHTQISKRIISELRLIRKKTGLSDVVLSGGVFQNTFLMKELLEMKKNLPSTATKRSRQMTLVYLWDRLIIILIPKSKILVHNSL